MTFVKRTIRGEKKDKEEEEDTKVSNAFEEDNIFLKPEAKEEGEEEDESDDKELDEEEEEKLMEEIK